MTVDNRDPPRGAHVALSGRRAQAARNDQIILDAARHVFLVDPDAPIAAVAQHAGVGISALYRRYRSKDELIQRLASDGLQRYIAEVEAALAAPEAEVELAFTSFMIRSVAAGTASVTLRFAGRFTPTEELTREGSRAFEITQRLLERARAAGVLRPDLEVADLPLLFEMLQAVQVKDAQRTAELRQRYLALLLDGFRATGEPLPGPAPTWQEMTARYAP